MRENGAPRSAIAAATLAVIALSSSPIAAQTSRTFRYEALDNGSFAEPAATFEDARGVRRVSAWRTSRGAAQLVGDAEHGFALRTDRGDFAEQPIAAFAPLASTLEIRGSVRGAGRVVLVVPQSGRAAIDVGTAGGAAVEFVLPAQRFADALHAPLVPRFVLRLEPADDQGAEWSALSARVDLPLPSESELRARIVDELDRIFTTWNERALDDFGPRKTAFVARSFDVITGAELGRIVPAPTFFAYQSASFDAWCATHDPRWSAELERYLDDFFALALHPTTGLPRGWDPVADAPVDDRPIEIALVQGFLVDVAERGPERFRDRARAAAIRIGETVLAHGQLPDGEIAASYRPSDAEPNLALVRLRRLDVPCQLVRLARASGEARFAKAARVAFAELELTNYWSGTWDAIDPGFDDEFGHYGARAATAATTADADLLVRRFAVDGLRHYLPLWDAALRFGGNLAADQVRCWKTANDLARLEPSLADEVRALVHRAARVHFRGEQYGNGAWGDVTMFDFDPVPTGLQVGDYTGTPQNLLNGLAEAYEREHASDEIRALYAAVLASTITEYRKPYGYLASRGASSGANPAQGSLRILSGLTRMLERLPQ